MKKNYKSLLRIKMMDYYYKFKKTYYRFIGLKIGTGGHLGKIFCEWPDRIRIGNDTVIEDNIVFKITKPFISDNYISIGSSVFIGHGCQFNCNTQIIIGDNCLIASGTIFVDTGHEIAMGSDINKQPLTLGEITIEEGVWIGTGCRILKGVTIGKGSVIGAGSVVNKSIPEYQIWAGTPARFIRNRE